MDSSKYYINREPSTLEESGYSTDIRLTSKPSLRHHFSLLLQYIFKLIPCSELSFRGPNLGSHHIGTFIFHPFWIEIPILSLTAVVIGSWVPAVRVFANGPGDLGSIPGRVIPKTLKMVLDTTLLNTQHYKVRFKGKVEQSWEWSSALPYTLV